MLQQKLAPAVPQWLIAEREADMQIDERMLRCTAFLGVPTERGFSAEGTGFFLQVPLEGLAFLYMVSCRHVVRPTRSLRDKTPNDDPIWIRANRTGRLPKPIETKRSDWLYDLDNTIDVCVYPVPFYKWETYYPDLEISPLNTDNILLPDVLEKRLTVGLGDEIYIVGSFVGQIGEKKNIPVVRTANIAAMPDEPLWGGSHRKPVFLIETRSLGGISGSPIYFPLSRLRPGMRPAVIEMESTQTIVPYYLMGMMQGVHSGQYADDFSPAEDRVVPKDADFNAGIGVAIPISQIMELINRTDLVEARLATLEAKKKQTGHRDASSKSPSAADGDENPAHLEDFKRLVDVAARKRPQDD
jgi:hypothetical protein